MLKKVRTAAKLRPKRRTDHTSGIEIEQPYPPFNLDSPSRFHRNQAVVDSLRFPFEMRAHSIHDIGQNVAP
jgi:hypothetical protein